jgi:hypothetical protein
LDRPNSKNSDTESPRDIRVRNARSDHEIRKVRREPIGIATEEEEMNSEETDRCHTAVLLLNSTSFGLGDEMIIVFKLTHIIPKVFLMGREPLILTNEACLFQFDPVCDDKKHSVAELAKAGIAQSV